MKTHMYTYALLQLGLAVAYGLATDGEVVENGNPIRSDDRQEAIPEEVKEQFTEFDAPPEPEDKGVEVTNVEQAKGSCQAFFSVHWFSPIYQNQLARLDVDIIDTGGSEIRSWLDGSTQSAPIPPHAHTEMIDILTWEADGEPDGYALSPGPYVLIGRQWQGSLLCQQMVAFSAIPPPVTVTAEEAPFWEHPTRQVDLEFSIDFMLDEPMAEYIWVPSPAISIFYDFGSIQFTAVYGGTADAGSDFTGIGSPSTWDGDQVTFAPGTTTTTRTFTILDDICPENTETIHVYHMHEYDASTWGTSPFFFALAGYQEFLILDDDDFRPPCAISYEEVKELSP